MCEGAMKYREERIKELKEEISEYERIIELIEEEIYEIEQELNYESEIEDKFMFASGNR